MRLRDILKLSSIEKNLKSTNKDDVLKELSNLLGEEIKDKKKIVKILSERENLGSTGIGQGIAVPHGKVEGLDKLVAVLGISKKGIDFNSLDGEPVYIFFLLVAPKDAAGPHLKALARISRILRDASFCDVLRRAQDEQLVYNLIVKEDEKSQ